MRQALYQESILSGGNDAIIANHFMYKQTDLLALGTALEKLDPSITVKTDPIDLEAEATAHKKLVDEVGFNAPHTR